MNSLDDLPGSVGTTRFFERLLVRLFPADPADFLNSEELQSVAPRAQRFDRMSGRVIYIGSLVCFGLIGLLLRWIDQLSRIPVTNPVWDKMDGWALFFPAFFLGFASGINLTGLYARRHWGEAIGLYYRYEATTARWNRRRALVWLTRIFVTAAAFLVVLLWHTGEVIGEDAIVFKDGFSPVHRYAYDDVASIGRYTKLHAPIGTVDFANLTITFKDGHSLRLRHRKRQIDAAELDELAEYVSARSSVPVTHGDLPISAE